MKFKHLAIAAAAIAAAVTTSTAFAQKAGTFTVELGLTHLAPDVKSGDLSQPAFPNTKSDVSADTQLTGAVNYAITDNIVAHVPLGYGFKHNLIGAGRAQGFGTIATVRALPISAFVQYRFGAPDAQIRPYLGVGLAYAVFYKATGSAALTALTNPGGATTLKIDNKLGAAIQLGATLNINKTYYINASYAKTFLKTTARMSTGQTQTTQLDPDAFSISVGRSF